MPCYARSFGAIALLILVLPLTAAHARSAQGSTTSVLGWYDLPKDDERSQELSGLAWDPETATLYAIPEMHSRIVRLNLGQDFRSVSFGETITVAVPDLWDGEGIARTSTGFFTTNETALTSTSLTSLVSLFPGSRLRAISIASAESVSGVTHTRR